MYFSSSRAFAVWKVYHSPPPSSKMCDAIKKRSFLRKFIFEHGKILIWNRYLFSSTLVFFLFSLMHSICCFSHNTPSLPRKAFLISIAKTKNLKIKLKSACNVMEILQKHELFHGYLTHFTRKADNVKRWHHNFPIRAYNFKSMREGEGEGSRVNAWNCRNINGENLTWKEANLMREYEGLGEGREIVQVCCDVQKLSRNLSIFVRIFEKIS